MTVPTTTTRYLRRQPSLPPRALQSIFDIDEEAASGEAVIRDHHVSNEKVYQDQPPKKPPQQQLQQDSAGWNTRATIFLSEAIVVTVVVGTVLICCLRKHHRRLTQQRVYASQQLQEWATIRVMPGGAAVPVGVAASTGGSRDGRRRVDSGIDGMSVSSRDGRIRVDSGISGMAAARQEDTPRDATVEHIEVNRTPVDRLLSIPRTLGNIVMYPLRLIEAGINSWATVNYDEVFMRQFMERLDAEREAARENPDEREVRLKEAFVKECMVWELDEENFIPPVSLFALSDIGGNDQDDTVMCVIESTGNEVNPGVCSLGEANDNKPKDERDQGTNKNEADVEEVKIEDNQVPDDDCQMESEVNCCEGEGKEEFIDDGPEKAPAESSNGATKEKVPNQNSTVTDNDCNCSDHTSVDGSDTPKDCQETTGDLSAPNSTVTSAYENTLATTHAATAMEQPMFQMVNEDITANATIAEQSFSTSLETRPRVNSAPTLPAAAMVDTFDTESTPGYLYLNTTGHRRRRANTGSSSGTNASSTNHSALSNAESMNSFASTSASSTSQDSHKIPNECAICLCDYEKGDTVVTSCNSECPHAFHQECIVEWLVKMQEGTPCPCCRRPFVQLDARIPRNISSNNTANNNATNDTAQDPEEAERLRQDRRRQSIVLGIQRGRAFNMSAITIRPNSNNNAVNDTVQDPEEVERLRQERRRQNIELGIRRGGRAFNTSVISLR